MGIGGSGGRLVGVYVGEPEARGRGGGGSGIPSGGGFGGGGVPFTLALPPGRAVARGGGGSGRRWMGVEAAGSGGEGRSGALERSEEDADAVEMLPGASGAVSVDAECVWVCACVVVVVGSDPCDALAGFVHGAQCATG